MPAQALPRFKKQRIFLRGDFNITEALQFLGAEGPSGKGADHLMCEPVHILEALQQEHKAAALRNGRKPALHRVPYVLEKRSLVFKRLRVKFRVAAGKPEPG